MQAGFWSFTCRPFISGSPSGYLYFDFKEVALLQSGLIVAGLSIVVLALFIMGARKTKLASFNFSFLELKIWHVWA